LQRFTCCWIPTSTQCNVVHSAQPHVNRRAFVKLLRHFFLCEMVAYAEQASSMFAFTVHALDELRALEEDLGAWDGAHPPQNSTAATRLGVAGRGRRRERRKGGGVLPPPAPGTRWALLKVRSRWPSVLSAHHPMPTPHHKRKQLCT
jgi:hypothetical protein